jgi:penicillin G amidase
MPSPGWVEENRWLGVTQYFANPRFVDPEGGILGNTNNKMVDRDFPLHVSFTWGDTQRITRLSRLMEDTARSIRATVSSRRSLTLFRPLRATSYRWSRVTCGSSSETAPDGTPERRRQSARWRCLRNGTAR